MTKNVVTRVASIIVAALLTLSLAACGGRNTVTIENLVGTWEQTMSDGTATVQLTSDGRYISDIRMYDGTSTHNEHTWDFSDGKLTVHYTNMGVDSTYSVEIKDGRMKLDNGSSTIIYTRK